MAPDEIEQQVLRRADVVVIAIGRSKFLHAGMTKKDAVIIDVGTNHDEQGALCGDVDVATYEPYEAWITPVPGGVGPMTIALLLLNVVRAALRSHVVGHE
jgi:methylenetetrahydrofolate dehydrogenase (NADP+)/methenyltetrahydrofolate cyclohydrolase